MEDVRLATEQVVQILNMLTGLSVSKPFRNTKFIYKNGLVVRKDKWGYHQISNPRAAARRALTNMISCRKRERQRFLERVGEECPLVMVQLRKDLWVVIKQLEYIKKLI